ncbi:MAG: DNA polymerase III subunit delta' [Alphaproteobacteria bacterium]|nr:DNA polymerase III subunit delta' [Alphaproteobacteria bacterium]
MTESEASTTPLPRTNPELLGHEKAERLLLEAWHSGRLPHAWLVTGPKGVGKATLAHRFARFVLAGGSGKDSLYVPPDHGVFQRAAAGSLADLLTIESATEATSGRKRPDIPVEESRRIGPFLTMTAAEGGWRVVVVDAADDLNRTAGNAILKLLEEPPAKALLLLVSHNPGRVLPTIRSRCRHLALRPLDDACMEQLLRAYRGELDGEVRTALIRLAEGSIGQALDLAEEGGIELYRDLIRILESLPDLDVPELHAFANRLSGPKAGASWRVTTDLLSRWVAGMVKGGALGRDMPEIIGGENALGRRLQAGANLAEWVEVWEKITRLSAVAERSNLDRRQVLVNVFHTLEGAARQTNEPAG